MVTHLLQFVCLCIIIIIIIIDTHMSINTENGMNTHDLYLSAVCLLYFVEQPSIYGHYKTRRYYFNKYLRKYAFFIEKKVLNTFIRPHRIM